VCWKPCSSCWSFHLLREECLSAPIHSPPSLVRRIGPSVPNMASAIHCFRPISPRSPRLVEHCPSHLTKGTIFHFNHTILTSHTGRRKLMLQTQITTKGFETRVFKFTTIVSTNSSNNMSIPIVLQPQD
jgi:hypothetical protein